MNTYRILYTDSARRVRYVQADSVRRFDETPDRYTFVAGDEVVAEIARIDVLSIDTTTVGPDGLLRADASST